MAFETWKGDEIAPRKPKVVRERGKPKKERRGLFSTKNLERNPGVKEITEGDKGPSIKASFLFRKTYLVTHPVLVQWIPEPVVSQFFLASILGPRSGLIADHLCV